MKNIYLTFLFLFSTCALFPQVEIKRFELSGKTVDLNFDSLLNTSQVSFDSIILKKLYVLRKIDEGSGCNGCTGHIVKSYLIYKNKLVNQKILRGFENEKFNRIISIQHDKVFKEVLKHCTFKKENMYIIWVIIRIDESEDEKVYIDRGNSIKSIVISRKRRIILYK